MGKKNQTLWRWPNLSSDCAKTLKSCLAGCPAVPFTCRAGSACTRAPARTSPTLTLPGTPLLAFTQGAGSLSLHHHTNPLLACFGIQFSWVLLLWLWKMEEVEGGAPLIICLNNTGNILLGNRGVREDDDSLPKEQRTWLMTQPWLWGSPSHKTRQNKHEGQRQGSCQAEEHRRLTRRCNCTCRESWSSSWICWVREKSSPGK